MASSMWSTACTNSSQGYAFLKKLACKVLVDGCEFTTGGSQEKLGMEEEHQFL